MKTKNLVIIFISLLLALVSGWAVFSTREKGQPALSQTGKIVDLSSRPVAKEKPIVRPEKTALSETNGGEVETIQVVMLINGAEYLTATKPVSSVYDLMNALREQNRIDFKSNNYSGMGFFITEINGVKNDPAGKNWLYYVNDKLAPIGISFYKLKNNDTIEWKYEKKSF